MTYSDDHLDAGFEAASPRTTVGGSGLVLLLLVATGCALPEDEGIVELVFRPAMHEAPVSGDGYVLECSSMGLALGPVRMFEADADGHDDHGHEHATLPRGMRWTPRAQRSVGGELSSRPKPTGHGGDTSDEVPEGLVGESVGRTWIDVAAGVDVLGVPVHVRVDTFAGDVDAELGDVDVGRRRIALGFSCGFADEDGPARVEGSVSLAVPAPIHIESPVIWLRDGGTFVVEVDPSGAFAAVAVADLPEGTDGVRHLEEAPDAQAAFVEALAASEPLRGRFLPPE